MRKTFYYTDELNDDFATTVPKDKIKPLPKNYRYLTKNIFGWLFAGCVYHGLAKPLAWLYLKIKFHLRFVNRRILKQTKQGAFLFANHALVVGDVLISNAAQFGRKNYILSGEQANSLTPLLWIMRAVGNIPLTDSLQQNIKMMRCIKTRLGQGATITIFPEAHAWPYYTDIRPFPATSFKYAAINHAPIICMITCFEKRKHSQKPKVTVYFEGPFYPKDNLSANENAAFLRDAVYQCMKARTQASSTYAYYTYQKSENQK